MEGLGSMQQSTRGYLAQYFSDMAGWHTSSLQEENGAAQDDKRLLAGFYTIIAEHIEQLPDDDLRLVALARLTGFDDRTGFSPGPHVSAAIADAGQFAEGAPEPFLEYLVHAALDDHLESQPHVTSILIDGIEAHASRV